MKVLDIGEVSAQTGFPASALRYYEEVGLISSIARHGLRRQFAPEVLVQLKLIALGKTAGFSLDEISAMFGKTGAPDLPRAMLHEKADALDRQIRDLTALRDTLRHVAECRAPSHMECPTFRRLVELAGKHGKLRARKGVGKKSVLKEKKSGVDA
ncbi:helix-turn-helix domain-containing protein [Rhodospirillum rubrum]|uniref:Transcriptional regulator, MerR family n=1 Tax=Rhodospirillum rubrum (strain ATCC 11170 / ATH 1.1.1 / DSM 467 / LMG 4362 / NCIMB 8255 / S1) TaxID=269796 RepID=Q2RXF8_RHORT|nr:helix-turn-helix domain-containing protein [Rhodospirillum rubrum]ABC21187.1 transcriptional regulator, MerR family [Rhodospirillum rubrum ATCC 11170]AEO46861.1 MerR family transcriptional regulator [Rhodospirillum rubrum F11]MBK5952735.1 MerR family transcriptional regulator [Rhodospirillum rubrum]QXG80878.1 helix-turn-helix domain-containing protein [Rhodospirillum rubrum]HAP99537.1 MerR family transcriptional regulator [Rhodospirillum rubrum]